MARASKLILKQMEIYIKIKMYSKISKQKYQKWIC